MKVGVIEVDEVHGDVVEGDDDSEDAEEDGDDEAVVEELLHADLTAWNYTVFGRIPRRRAYF